MASHRFSPDMTIVIPSDPKFLGIIRDATRRCAAMAGFEGSLGEQICLAIDEACTNVIRHSYDGARDQRILFQCGVTRGESIAFRLRDFGRKAPAEALKSRDLDDVRPGGLGLHFIRQIMDEVEFNTKPTIGTELLLLKKVSPQESDEEQES